ncbi:MAG: DUF305 domain-containing protein [Actinomycetota bacterium]|nr:DUF305 domain-containing protein [Actinomycetota bacterium]
MNRITRALALAAATVLGGAVLAGCGSSTPDTQPAQSVPASQVAVADGSEADVAFAQLMIPHHAQAVEMADLALQQGTSPDVLSLASQIKAAQGPEIEQMRGWLGAWGAPEQMDGAEGDDHGDMDMGGMNASGMMTDEDMNSLMNASGEEFDRMWLQMMITHHQGAIQMAEQVLADSTNPDVIALADAVVAGQTAEIDAMQQLLAN